MQNTPLKGVSVIYSRRGFEPRTAHFFGYLLLSIIKALTSNSQGTLGDLIVPPHNMTLFGLLPNVCGIQLRASITTVVGLLALPFCH